MGMFSGAIYGAVAEILAIVRAGNGLVFGAVLWWLADNTALPAIGCRRGRRHISRLPTRMRSRRTWSTASWPRPCGACFYSSPRQFQRSPIIWAIDTTRLDELVRVIPAAIGV